MADPLPLSGIRVFEFGSNLAGPYAGWILAQLGADVVKIERPEGDDARAWGPPFWKGSSTVFHVVNRDKTSVVADLKDRATVEELKARIAEEGDVVVQNLRSGVMDRLGFSAEALLADNPRLIYCNLHAFGAKGPLKHRPGYDVLMQGFGGVMSVTGEEDGSPVRAGVSLIDMGTGMWCAIGILAALRRRDESGRGGVVDASLFETALEWMCIHSCDHQVTGKLPKRRGSGARGLAPYEAYACADGMLIITASNDRLFAKLAAALGRPEWIKDERFVTNPERDKNRDELKRLLEEILKGAPREHWKQLLDEAGVPNSPIQSIDEVVRHPQTAALGILQQTEDPNVKLCGLPISFDGVRPPMKNLAPPLSAEQIV